MARNQRSSDGPMPYGPSGRPPEPPADETQPLDVPAWGAPPADAGATAADPGLPPPPAPGLPPPPTPGLPPSVAPPPIAPWAPPPGAYGTSVPGAMGLQYGRTLDRSMAYILDGIIVAIPAIILAAILGGGAGAAGLRPGGASLLAGVVAVGIHLLYFVAFWTGSSRATPGMRLMKLQIADAKTGATLTVQQGIIRWLALGGALQIVQVVPILAELGAILAFFWSLLLLATTATSPTKQGLHDRIADSALVQPAGAQTPAQTCLIAVVALLVLWILGIVALIFLGSQVSQILSDVGSSI